MLPSGRSSSQNRRMGCNVLRRTIIPRTDGSSPWCETRTLRNPRTAWLHRRATDSRTDYNRDVVLIEVKTKAEALNGPEHVLPPAAPAATAVASSDQRRSWEWIPLFLLA